MAELRKALPLLLVLLTAACGTRVREVDPGPSPTPSATPTPSVSASATPSATTSAGASASASASPAPTVTASPLPGALALVGWWSVTQPAGAGTLGLGQELTVVHACGRTTGSWGASPSGLFLGYPVGGDDSCYQKPPRPDVRWLEIARSFGVKGSILTLRGYDGNVVATATRTTAPSGQQEPTLTPALRAKLAAPAPLPKGVTPATAASLAGRWSPRGKDAGNGKGYVSFALSGAWSGSDGCNNAGGSYALGKKGELLTTAGPTTLIGCDRTPAPDWVGRARSAGHRDGVLHLYDTKGTLLGRLFPP